MCASAAVIEARAQSVLNASLEEINLRNSCLFWGDELRYIIKNNEYPPQLTSCLRRTLTRHGIVNVKRLGIRGGYKIKVSDPALAILNEIKKGDRVLD